MTDCTLAPAAEAPANSGKKAVLATLVMRGAGMGSQRLRTPKGILEFSYRPGVGHIREYTDLTAFHAEEAFIRSLRAPQEIRTVIGAIDTYATAEGAIGMLIANKSGHRPTKLGQLKGLRGLLEREIGRLEEALAEGAQKIEAADHVEVEPAPLLTPRLQAMGERRNSLRASGEHFTRGVLEGYGLQVPKYHNHEGMIEAIVALEFPEDWQPPVYEKDPKDGKFVAVNPEVIVSQAGKKEEAVDLAGMPLAELREYALARGVSARSRGAILEALQETGNRKPETGKRF